MEIKKRVNKKFLNSKLYNKTTDSYSKTIQTSKKKKKNSPAKSLEAAPSSLCQIKKKTAMDLKEMESTGP